MMGAAEAFRYERSRMADPALRARFEVIERTLLRLVAPAERVLDVGCGTGRVTVRLTNPCVIGLDPNRRLLAGARARALQLAIGDGNALPFSAGVFDAVISTDSAFAQLDFARALPECARVLRAGGLLIVHQKANRVWSLRRPFGLTCIPGAADDRSPARLIAEARAAGLPLERAELYRWVRFSPYLLKVPSRAALPLWNHGLFIFRRFS